MRGCIRCHGPLDDQRNCYICDKAPPMTDLSSRLREAAEKATANPLRDRIERGYDHLAALNARSELHALVSAENIIALLDELEAKDREIASAARNAFAAHMEERNLREAAESKRDRALDALRAIRDEPFISQGQAHTLQAIAANALLPTGDES